MSSNAGENNYTDSMKGIITDRFSFEYFITNDFLYVDKTMYAYELVESDKNFFFVSRPRRFGKSLFCSTLHSIFDGKKDLFKGLYIAEETDYSFEKYPVIHLDFSKMSLLSEQAALNALQKRILGAAEDNGISIERDSPSEMLDDLIMKATRATGKQVVIIIDEFDSPFTSKISWKPELIEYIRELFNEFYKSIKADSAYIRFFFMTGCVRLSNLSIFSAMNNLYDISMDRRFAGAFGYTEKELEDNFGEGMDEYLEANPGIYGSKEEFIGRIRDYYDGYRFSPRSDIKVYNPVSIGRFFDRLECKFDNYWEKTGVSTMAVGLARRCNLVSLLSENSSLLLPSFSSFDISLISEAKLSRSSVLALLYYAGYLTIADSDDDGVELGFPNMEIRSSFIQSLSLLYADNGDDAAGMIIQGAKAARRGDAEKMIYSLNEFCRQSSGQIIREKLENPYHLIAHMFFVACGCRVTAEDSTSRGRIDLTVEKDKHLYIMELKIDGSADEAMKQIKDRDYAGKYIGYARKSGIDIHLIGISFSSKERKVAEWKEEALSPGSC